MAITFIKILKTEQFMVLQSEDIPCNNNLIAKKKKKTTNLQL